MGFQKDYEIWMQRQIAEEKNHRRKEILSKGLSYGSVEFLRSAWHPAIGNFDCLHSEWEVRDLHNKIRYLDFAYLPGKVKGNIEIQDYATHARDLDLARFKDLCRRQSLLSLDDWIYFPIAYMSIRDEPELCKQMVLSFVGKFLSLDAPSHLNWLEAETIRYARRLLRPFTPMELAAHLRVTDSYARRILHQLVEHENLVVASGNMRFRRYQLNVGEHLRNRELLFKKDS